MKKKRRLISLFLILIFLLITGRFLFFISYIKSQKPVFRSQLIQQNLSSVKPIKIDAKDLYSNSGSMQWKEGNKELVIHGVYHEVISIKKLANSVLVFVIEDKEENQLFEKYFSLNKNRSTFVVELLKLLSYLTYIQNPSFRLNSPVFSDKNETNTLQFILNQFKMKLIKPPKRIAG